MTGNPEVISSPVGLIPTNALAVTVGLLARSRLLGTNLAVAGADYFRLADKLPKRWVRL